MAQHGTILPGSKIGILGGGQLGRMMAFEGKKMGYDIVVLDPTPNAPGAQAADKQVVGGLNDLAAAKELAEQVDVLVYEFENLDVNVVQELERNYRLPQGSKISASPKTASRKRPTCATMASLWCHLQSSIIPRIWTKRWLRSASQAY